MSISHPIADDPLPQAFRRADIALIAGHDVYAAIMRELTARCPKLPSGKYDARALATMHAQQSVRGFLGAEVRRCVFGWGLYYDSGLQNFGFIASEPSREAIEALAVRWAASDPLFRYVWTWNHGRS